MSAIAGSRPLVGLQVADFTNFWAGPMATTYLAHLGANVIKVESPVPTRPGAVHAERSPAASRGGSAGPST